MYNVQLANMFVSSLFLAFMYGLIRIPLMFGNICCHAFYKSRNVIKYVFVCFIWHTMIETETLTTKDNTLLTRTERISLFTPVFDKYLTKFYLYFWVNIVRSKSSVSFFPCEIHLQYRRRTQIDQKRGWLERLIAFLTRTASQIQRSYLWKTWWK